MAEVALRCPISHRASVTTLQPQNMLVALVMTYQKQVMWHAEQATAAHAEVPNTLAEGEDWYR